MKFSQSANIEEYKKAIGVGAIKGLGVGALISVGAAFALRRRTNFFKNAGGLQKGLVYAAPSAFAGITFMEAASREFENHQREKQHGLVDEDLKHPSATTWDATAEWFSANKYKVVVAGWAASLGGSFWAVNRDPYMTKAQKIVQARVYAQGLTVAMLLATVFLGVKGTTKPSDIEEQKKKNASQSWERDLNFVESANRGRQSK